MHSGTVVSPSVLGKSRADRRGGGIAWVWLTARPRSVYVSKLLFLLLISLMNHNSPGKTTVIFFVVLFH